MKNVLEFRAWERGTSSYLFFTLNEALRGELKDLDWCLKAEIQQCIGVEDKHGRPIFEGDLLKTPQDTTCQVIWSPPEFWIQCLDTGETRIKLPSYLKLCEVVGNNAKIPLPCV